MNRNLALLGTMLPIAIWSAIAPYDRLTWWLEVAPVIVGFALIFAVRARFQFCRFAMVLIGIHMAILLVGGHYTYARVPLFDWIRDAMGLARNHYDRLGHVAQGAIPSIIAREILLKNRAVRGAGWLFFLIVCIAMAVSALYELLEWGAAVFTGEAAEQFLATQGDPWDTQKDMALCGVGSLLSLLVLRRAHDRSMEKDRQVP
ncbi:MAG: DUF2238 domain-containing protein [Verrucomicrobiales bacterium]